MKRKAVAFYWTLPVPWAVFTELSSEADEAAEQSKTIRYQRDLIRSYARDEGFDLLHEEAFLELEPDRGSEQILTPLKKLAVVARENDATLLYVDFGGVLGWRSHSVMQEWVEKNVMNHLPVWPEAIHLDDDLFDPESHFGSWREKQKAWTASKASREATAGLEALQLRGQGLKYDAIAYELERRGLRSATGKRWTGEAVRKLLKKLQRKG